MSGSPAEDNRAELEMLAENPEHVTVTCTSCGFDDVALDSDWDTDVETDPQSGRIRYRFTCPDCGGVTTVDVENR